MWLPKYIKPEFAEVNRKFVFNRLEMLCPNSFIFDHLGMPESRLTIVGLSQGARRSKKPPKPGGLAQEVTRLYMSLKNPNTKQPWPKDKGQSLTSFMGVKAFQPMRTSGRLLFLELTKNLSKN